MITRKSYLSCALIILSTFITKAQDLIECENNIILFEKVDVKCFGNTDGQINIIQPTNVSSSFQLINLDQGKIIRDFTSDTHFGFLESANYRIIIKDTLDYSCYEDITLNSQEKIEIKKENIIPTKPNSGKSDGSLNITFSGGSPPYKIFITKIDSPEADTVLLPSIPHKIIDNLGSGIYTITIEDGNGCLTKGLQYELSEKNNFDFSISQEAKTCEKEGRFQISLSNGQKPYSIEVRHNTNIVDSKSTYNEDLYSLPLTNGLGKYKLKINDKRKIPITIEYNYVDLDCHLNVTTNTIDQPSISKLNNGKVQVSIQNGSAPFHIKCLSQLTNESVFDKHTSLSSVVFSNLKEGSYYIDIIDNEGRHYNKAINIKTFIPDSEQSLKEFNENKNRFLKELYTCDCNLKSLENWQKGIRITVSTVGLAGTIASAGAGTLLGGVITGIITTGGTLTNEFASHKKVDQLKIRNQKLKEVEILYSNFTNTDFDSANWDTDKVLEYEAFKKEVLKIRHSFTKELNPTCKLEKIQRKYHWQPIN